MTQSRASHAILLSGLALAFVGAGSPRAIAQPTVRSIDPGPLNTPGPLDPHTNQDDCPTPTVARTGSVPSVGNALNVIYVDQNAIGNNHGRCWKHAYVDLQAALTEAAGRPRPVEIWVADGTYRPDRGTGNPAESFELLDDVAIYGGFAGFERSKRQRNSDPATNGTVLSGLLIANQDPPVRSAHLIVSIASNRGAILDGFRIEQGQAGVPGLPGDTGDGGGAQLLGSNAIIRNCLFAANEAAGLGGAVYVDGGEPLIQSCWFQWNTAGDGGAVAAVGLAAPSLRYCTFFANGALGRGGAFFTSDDSAGCVSGARFVGNHADSGGAVHRAARSNAVIVNSLFSGNQADVGGAITYADAAAGLLLNSTVTANQAQVGGGIAFVSSGTIAVRNSILWRNADSFGNVGQQFHTNQDGVEPDFAYCVVPGWTGGIGNLALDPRFRDPIGDDGVSGTLDDNLRLLAISPCIDAADNSAWSNGDIASGAVLFDLDQQPRFRDDPLTPDTGVGPPPVVDMGAYEFNRTTQSAPTDPG